MTPARPAAWWVKRFSPPTGTRGRAGAGIADRAVRAARGYAGAVLLNWALVRTVLSAPPPRRAAQVRVAPTGSQFHPLETLRSGDGVLVGVLTLAMAPGAPHSGPALN